MEGTVNQPFLSVVVITWKMRDLLERMLDSLYRFMPAIEFEVLLVDNGSRDGTLEMVESRFPGIRLIRNEENRGVAAARNQALRIARGRHVAILDADLELVEDALGPILSFLEASPDYGIAGARLIFPDGTTQFNAKRFPSLGALLSRRIPLLRAFDGGKALAHHEMHDWDRTSSQEVDYLIGACQIIRREVLDQIGLLDETIFYGPEDIDFCLRARQAGWKIWWKHDVRIIHHEQRSTKKNPLSNLSRKHYKGLWHFFRKHGLRYSQVPFSTSNG
jgi:GT2 family glycosyltransferase